MTSKHSTPMQGGESLALVHAEGAVLFAVATRLRAAGSCSTAVAGKIMERPLISHHGRKSRLWTRPVR